MSIYCIVNIVRSSFERKIIVFRENVFDRSREKCGETRRWRVREHSPPSFGLRRGGATPGVVSSAACAVILARSFFGSGVGAHSSYNSSRINKPFLFFLTFTFDRPAIL